MLTYRTGAAGSPSAAASMAEHLLQQTLPEAQAELAQYYGRGIGGPDWDASVAEPLKWTRS
jgi:hypothetical protein